MNRNEYKTLLTATGFQFIKSQIARPSKLGEEDVYSHPKYNNQFYITRIDKDRQYGFNPQWETGRIFDNLIPHNAEGDKGYLLWTDDAFKELMAHLRSNNNYTSREDLYKAGLHNSYQKGIGKAKDGSGLISIVLSGGYPDDEDYGDEIIYTGEGGQDPKTKKQIKDQVLEGGNLDLLKSFELGKPIYVIRGSKHKSNLSPKEGYTFYGKYSIIDHWIEAGRDGFNIVRFKLVKESVQSPIVDTVIIDKDTKRVEYTSTRVIRDTKVAIQVKEIYDFKCQICELIIDLPSGNKYAEGAHIKPLGMPHNGPDNISNILCLCPNHHLMFDRYSLSINPVDLSINGTASGTLLTSIEHPINREHLQYHWDNYIKHS